MRALAFGIVLFVGAAGCGDDKNKLYGSVSEVYDLTFDSVKLSRVGEFFVVDYVRESGPASSLGKAAKLSVNLTGIMLAAGQTIDLVEMVGTGTRGTLQRVQQGTTELPMEVGNFVLDKLPDGAAEVTGHFHATLSNPKGRT